MASPHVDFATNGTKKKHNSSSPKNIKKELSPRPSSSSHRHLPVCICAPSTHPGSFKCRLHRVNSEGQSPKSPTLFQQSSSGETRSMTVEAQLLMDTINKTTLGKDSAALQLQDYRSNRIK